MIIYFHWLDVQSEGGGIGISDYELPGVIDAGAKVAQINPFVVGASIGNVHVAALERFVVEHKLHRDQQIPVELQKHNF